MALSKLTDIRKSLSVEVEDLQVNGIGTFSGNVSVGGTLTYQDVTNIDSVGLITARSVIHVSGGNIKIGTTTEGAHTADDLTIAAANGTTGITLRSGTGNAGNIFFSDGTSGDDEFRGFIQYYQYRDCRPKGCKVTSCQSWRSGKKSAARPRP